MNEGNFFQRINEERIKDESILGRPPVKWINEVESVEERVSKQRNE